MQGYQYHDAIDLRPDGLSSVLYLNSKASGSDKLVLFGVGEMSFAEITSQVATLFYGDTERLKVKRIDLAVDVVDYSVRWFKGHTSVAMKRSGCEFGRLYRDERARVETLYFGARPNVIRIYDKLAQLRVQTRRTKMRWQQVGASPHAGNESCEQSRPLTRVEHQYGGGRIPQELETLGNLRDKALNINPFEPLEFSATGYAPIPDDLGGSPFLKTLGMRTLVADRGLQGAMAELNHRTGGKAKRLLRSIPGYSDEDEPVKFPDLVTKYRQSLAAQLNYEFRQEGAS
jgi:hypothetical protein